MIGPLHAVFLTVDLTDEEPAGVLILNGPVEVWTRQRDMREDPLVHCPLYQTLAAVAPLRDHGLPLGPEALQTVHGEMGPGLVGLELGRGDPLGEHALGVEPAPRLDGRVGQEHLLAPRRGEARRSGRRRGELARVRDDAPMFDSEHRRTLRNCAGPVADRKSTRLNSSHMSISYAVFCLKKK